MSKYFVTGGGGFLAKHLIPKLQSLGHEVVTDMRYLHTRKYDCLIHLAAKTSISCDFDADLVESNIILTREIFKVNTRIIFGSSCSSAHLTNPYAYTKRYGEHLAALHGNAVSLRFHNIYGTGATRGIVWWLVQQKDGAKITIRGPELIRDYIHVDDVVNAISERLHTIRAICVGVDDIGTGVGTKTIDLVSLYSKLSGKKFILDGVAGNSTEPPEMVSNNIVPHISLEEGLTKMINNA